MPTSIKDIITQFKQQSIHPVKWGQQIPTESEGIYIVSMSEEAAYNNILYESIPLSKAILADWIKQLHGFTLDKVITSDVDKISERLAQFWLPDESILYIGKAPERNMGRGLGNRVNEFYRTKYGKRSPHAGGHWIKALEILKDLHIHYFLCDCCGDMEIKVLEYFMSNVSETTRQKLKDKGLVLPFANLELKRGQIKKHGLGNMKR